MTWIDISQTLTDDTAHWPEDAPFSFELPVTKAETGSVNIGKITTSTHTGTHIDAPFHFDEAGGTVETLDINRYIGDATIISVYDTEVITKPMLSSFEIKGTILLIKTQDAYDTETFPETVPVLDGDAVEYLASAGIKLFGIDVPSVDALDSKDLTIHHKLHQNDIMIIENVVLAGTPDGFYDFIALPLKIKGGDGSPVRAAVKAKGE
ncbi:cyclase family protein [Salinicoccus halitifaciens]|uniref:Arylformamidase n=1 Tax=Salinicoccus halitifaciens TaxID=1073415 RepID=A0ABV2EA00_9STAP|nr:cyclase family protein [Salinicoccus halitifaciens]MCD2138365.1 cyclase family protein [Salinicoccus halitifaciens]